MAERCHAECEEYRKFQEENERIMGNRKKDTISRSTIFRANYHS